MNFDYQNQILENIFTDEEVAQIYEHIESTPDERKHFVEVFSHTAYMNWMPDNIVDTIVKKAQEASDVPIILRELSFARYKQVSDEYEVKLSPHRDETFREPRITVDIQLGGNVSWPIVVEGREYTLQNNQALTFAGTHQIHWRTKRTFDKDDYLDMIFCHFSAADYVENELGEFDPINPPSFENYPEHDKIMKIRADQWTEIYNES